MLRAPFAKPQPEEEKLSDHQYTQEEVDEAKSKAWKEMALNGKTRLQRRREQKEADKAWKKHQKEEAELIRISNEKEIFVHGNLEMFKELISLGTEATLKWLAENGKMISETLYEVRTRELIQFESFRNRATIKKI